MARGCNFCQRDIEKIKCEGPKLTNYFYSSGTSSSPALMSSMRSCGGLPSTVQPTDWQEPRISLTVPSSFLAIDLALMDFAIVRTSSKLTLPLCLTFFTFLRSLGGSFRALMINEAAEGTTEIAACLF